MIPLQKPGNSTARKALLSCCVFPLVYVLVGRLGLILAVPPGYATAVFLPAGIAVAAAFMMGAASVPGTFIGSLLLNIWIGYAVGHPLGAVNVAIAVIIASASALQAGVGGALLRRVIGYPSSLDTLRDLLFFLVLSPCICLTSTTISNAGMWVVGVLQPGDFAVNWLTWWFGDTLGVLVVLPIMLVLAGEPRRLWRLRRWYVALPMILFFSLFVSLCIQFKIHEEAQPTSQASSADYLMRREAWQNWFILTAGVLSTGLLGAFLMLGSGQAYRIRVKQEELETVLRGTPVMLTRCSRDLRYRFISESYGQMLGLRPEDVVGKNIAAIVGNQAFTTMRPYIEKVLQGERVEYETEVPYRGTGVRTIHVVYTPDKDEQSEVVGWIASIRDITDQKQAQERERTLMLEVQHRSNNLLAVVQTIARRSLARHQSLDDARKAFESRLEALAGVNRQLAQANWRGVELHEAVRLEMEPFGGRCTVDGIDVMLGPKEGQNFTLALHELATNAGKYGALSNGSGNVGISWAITTSGKASILKFHWCEQGGPRVSEPVRHGFGSALLKTAFPGINLLYAPEGLNCEIELPLPTGLMPPST